MKANAPCVQLCFYVHMQGLEHNKKTRARSRTPAFYPPRAGAIGEGSRPEPMIRTMSLLQRERRLVKRRVYEMRLMWTSFITTRKGVLGRIGSCQAELSNCEVRERLSIRLASWMHDSSGPANRRGSCATTRRPRVEAVVTKRSIHYVMHARGLSEGVLGGTLRSNDGFCPTRSGQTAGTVSRDVVQRAPRVLYTCIRNSISIHPTVFGLSEGLLSSCRGVKMENK